MANLFACELLTGHKEYYKKISLVHAMFQGLIFD
jgi:hypothetical protein